GGLGTDRAVAERRTLGAHGDDPHVLRAPHPRTHRDSCSSAIAAAMIASTTSLFASAYASMSGQDRGASRRFTSSYRLRSPALVRSRSRNVRHRPISGTPGE